jgi:hypothetical protein
MEVSDIAAFQVAGAAALMQQSASIAMAKKAAEAQMQMANVIAQQAEKGKAQQGFSVYA